MEEWSKGKREQWKGLAKQRGCELWCFLGCCDKNRRRQNAFPDLIDPFFLGHKRMGFLVWIDEGFVVFYIYI